jgi:hypothetical protein
LKSYAPPEAHPRLRPYPPLIPLALFALAFAGTFMALNRPGSPAAALIRAGAPVVDAREVASSASEASSHDASLALGDSARPALDVRAGAVASMPPPLPPPLPEPAVTADDLDSSLPPSDPPPPHDVAPTIDTLRSGTPEDRVAAIQTLAATSPGGLAFGRVRQSLRFAAADPDPEIAARAQEAYDSLMKRDDP